MIVTVIGGSGSGKSAYAESLLEGFKSKYYIATMIPFGVEAQKRIERHQKLRQGKGFITIECPYDLMQACELIIQKLPKEKKQKTGVLLECMSNLVANEMFENQKETAHIDTVKIDTANIDTANIDTANIDAVNFGKQVVETTNIEKSIIQAIEKLAEQVELLVIVTNNIFEDGIDYGTETKNYMELLGKINRELAKRSTKVIEVVNTIPLVWKQESPLQNHKSK